jgi:D-proline reductase (dithiol) PrdB
MPVDSFKYLPRLIATFYQMTEREPEYPIPWAPLSRPISECKFSLVTSGGLHHKNVESPFDLERERDQPTWGDPSYRTIPTNISQSEIGVSHLHLNTEDVLQDVNILLPIQHFQEMVAEGRVGALAAHAYSFMGFQGYPPNTTEWQQRYAPEVAEKMKSEAVDCVFLTPA